jgi:hypothetical protein
VTTFEQVNVFLPWRMRYPEAGDAMRRAVPSIAAEQVEEIRREMPEYVRPHDVRYAEALELSVRYSLSQFVELVNDKAEAGIPWGQRRRLLDALISPVPGRSPEELMDHAKRASWPLPTAVAAVALRVRPGKTRHRPVPGPDVLTGLHLAEPCLIVPDPEGPGRPATLAAGLAGWDAAIGPAVPVFETAMSLSWARQALAGLACRIRHSAWSSRWSCTPGWPPIRPGRVSWKALRSVSKPALFIVVIRILRPVSVMES